MRLVPYPDWIEAAIGGPAKLTPCDHQAGRRIPVGWAAPVHRHPAIRGRQGAVFRGVRHELVKDHCDRLGRRGGEHDVRATRRRVCVGRVGRELVADEIGEADSVPATLAQQRVGGCHGLDAPIKSFNESIHRAAAWRVYLATTATRASTFLTRWSSSYSPSSPSPCARTSS